MSTCSASNKRGGPCRNTPVHGQVLCRAHGGPSGTPAEPQPTARPRLPWDQPGPTAAMHRALAVPGDSPATERWVTLRSVRVCNSDAYLVAVVDGRNLVADWRTTTLTPDLPRARTAANRLYARTYKEN